MNSPATFSVRRAAVLGAGVMGAQIAAQFVNAGIPVLLFELPAQGKDRSANARRAIAQLQKMEPAPFAHNDLAAYLTPCNYDDNLAQLAECDFVIEAIAEKLEWKIDLYKKIAPHIGANATLASNTSGLSVNELARHLPAELQQRFCGIHFFNPPRYMTLVEIIPHQGTEKTLLEPLEAFLTSRLGKGVVVAKDSPNFIANRIGVFSMLAIMHHAEDLKLPFDVVDALTGPVIGRPKSATFRTADVVGLDTFAHVVRTMTDNLPTDPWKQYYKLPAWLQALIAKGALGQKTGAGVFRKEGKTIQVFDPATGNYRPTGAELSKEVGAILAMKVPGQKLSALRSSTDPQAQFLWRYFRDLFHYTATHLQSIADSARDVDLALRWGFGWQIGPFELWQAADWQMITDAIAHEIDCGATMASTPLPPWVTEPNRTGVHGPLGSHNPTLHTSVARSANPVYARQLRPERLIGEPTETHESQFATDAVHIWHHPAFPDIGVLSFKTKMHTVSREVLDGTLAALKFAAQNYSGLVLWQDSPPFSAGANLKQVTEYVAKQDYDSIAETVAQFQRVSMAIRQTPIPVVAAVHGLALGGGCEFVMHCDHVVAAQESYIGLVEVGVGLVPAGAGCKELAIRASQLAVGSQKLPMYAKYLEQVGKGEVAKSAQQAKAMGYLRPSDTIIMNPAETLYVAMHQARALAETGYMPPLPAIAIPAAGRHILATLKSQLVNWLEGNFISTHDFRIANHIAEILCGGDVDPGTLLDEEWYLRLEREAFMSLMKTELTQARIVYMLENGKPLRN